MRRKVNRILLLACLFSRTALATSAESRQDPWFLVVAADRGFHGNTTIEERFADYQRRYPRSRLFFMTERQQTERLTALVGDLAEKGAEELVVLPVVVSDKEEPWRRFLRDLEGLPEGFPKIRKAPVFGQSALATEILRDHIQGLSRDSSEEHVTILGWGATDPESEEGLRETLARLAEPLFAGQAFRGWDVEVLWSSRESGVALEANREVYTRLIDRAARTPRPLLAPFFLGFRADHHMSVEASVARELAPYRLEWDPQMPDEHPLLTRWLERASAVWIRPSSESVGVVILAHGADQIWNEQIRRALEPVAERYDVEFSFNMADPALLQKAVGRLESRGKGTIIIYRLFGLQSSFANTISHVLGERGDGPEPSSHSGHGRPTDGTYVPVIRSGAHLVSVGGIEDHALFADALLERAKALSQGDPAHEVVLLVAHGARMDEDDRHWRAVLTSLAEQMQEAAQPPFHEVRGVTLREDWPEKRQKALVEIGSIVERYRKDGKRVLAVEARVNGPGPTRRLLAHLNIRVNEDGFVPHPNVSRLVLQELDQYLGSWTAPGTDRR